MIIYSIPEGRTGVCSAVLAVWLDHGTSSRDPAGQGSRARVFLVLTHIRYDDASVVCALCPDEQRMLERC